MKGETRTTPATVGITWGIFAAVLAWAAVKLSMAYESCGDFSLIRGAFAEELRAPFHLTWCGTTPTFLVLAFALWSMLFGGSLKTIGKWRRYGEHGTAEWASAKALRKKWEDKHAKKAADGTLQSDPNLIFSEQMRLGIGNGQVHRKNRNYMVIGGSGTGKSTGIVMPNIMQCNSSFVVTDPSGELTKALGRLLEERGYVVRVLNLVDMKNSYRTNPFAYLETPEDVGRLATSFIQNTEDKNKRGGDPFWTDAMRLLLMALIAFVWQHCPEDEQNFGTLTRLVTISEIEGEDMGSKSLLDRIFDNLGEESPDCLAYQNYLLFRGAPPKTRASVVITLSSRLSVFTLPTVIQLTSEDELELNRMGDRKQAVFCIIPQAETTFNFLVGLVYTSLFSALYRRGENVKRADGKNFLPVPVQVLMDEFSNIAQPESFEQILATCRKYGISIGIFLQNMTQLKKLYEKDWESIAGNCDTLVYLGGNEAFTWRFVSTALDKETINTSTTGRSGSNVNVNQNIIGRELLTKGEVRALPDDMCIVLVRGENGVLDRKYRISAHPNFKKTVPGGARPYVPDPEEVRGQKRAEERHLPDAGSGTDLDFPVWESKEST